MTKKDIVKHIAEQTNQPQLKIKEIVQMTFDTIVETLVKHGRIELRNFGVFEVKRRKARRARNPKTGEPVTVEPKNVVTFQPGKEMEIRVKKQTKSETKKLKKARPAPIVPFPPRAAAAPATPAVASVG